MTELMKTNAPMIRKMGNFDVTQRTKDGFFNATDLLKQWNKASVSERKLDNFFASEKTKEFINTIMERESLNTPKMVYLKSRGKKGGTWMHPMLFIDFAMWINPSFKYDVIKFVYDQMITYRKESCDAYKKLSSAVARIVPVNQMQLTMQDIARGINFCIVNRHETDIRNQYGDEETQRKYFDLQRKVSDLINEGFLTDRQQVMAYLRNRWQEIWQPKVFHK